MTSDKIRKKFLDYFRRFEHTVVPSSSLVPSNDPSVLLTTAGMQQLKPFFLNQANPVGVFGNRRLTSVQRCFRTSDIDQVGDGDHLTFFEMLGNFAIGDYSKEVAIRLAWGCLTKVFRIPKNRLWVTIFAGDERTVKDFESFKYWQDYVPEERIHEFPRSENWWGPPGPNGPCGPSSEIHYDRRGKPCERAELCRPNCPCGRFLELWNLVFMEYNQDSSGALRSLPTKNVDTGMGLERLAAVIQEKSSVFATDLFTPVIEAIQREPSFGAGESEVEKTRRLYIVADHLKGAVFLAADGVQFSNKDQGYILRRVFRRALDNLSFPMAAFPPIVDSIIKTYRAAYPFLDRQRQRIHLVLRQEADAFIEQVDNTIRRVTRRRLSRPAVESPNSQLAAKELSPSAAFELLATHGISLDRLRREGFTFDQGAVQRKIQAHRETSRAGAPGKFGGHGLSYALDASGLSPEQIKKVTRLHTATHLIHQALRTVLGQHVRQNGSDISPDRLRFDFTHPAKLSLEELTKIEQIVNRQIQLHLAVTWQELDLPEALESGALSFFREKYPARVKVYSIGDFSKEICGGPHVNNTADIGPVKIISEKSIAAGIRRLRAIIVP